MVKSDKHKDIEAVRGDMVEGDKHKFGIHIHGVIDTFPLLSRGKAISFESDESSIRRPPTQKIKNNRITCLLTDNLDVGKLYNLCLYEFWNNIFLFRVNLLPLHPNS